MITHVHWLFVESSDGPYLYVCMVVVILKANDLESLVLGELFEVLKSRWSLRVAIECDWWKRFKEIKFKSKMEIRRVLG